MLQVPVPLEAVTVAPLCGMGAVVMPSPTRVPKNAYRKVCAGTVTHGDSVHREDLFRADVIAFERNGNAPAASGGWESCERLPL